MPHLSKTQRPFIILSGLPGSGKSTLGKQLSYVFKLKFIDKDDILEDLFESDGVGDSNWRRRLSRNSDEIFRCRASASEGAVLVSWWHLSGMDSQSGTPTDWLTTLSESIVQVHCECDPEIAARRFFERKRHPGHLDSAKSYSDVLSGIQRLSLLDLDTRDFSVNVHVDTSSEPDLNTVVNAVRSALHGGG